MNLSTEYNVPENKKVYLIIKQSTIKTLNQDNFMSLKSYKLFFLHSIYWKYVSSFFTSIVVGLLPLCEPGNWILRTLLQMYIIKWWDDKNGDQKSKRKSLWNKLSENICIFVCVYIYNICIYDANKQHCSCTRVILCHSKNVLSYK